MIEIDWHRYCRTMADFVIASFQHPGDSNVVETIAGNVLAYSEGRLVTVSDLTELAAQHGWNSMIYEAWSWEFGNQIRAMARSLPAVQREALMLYAGASGDLDATRSEADDAIHDAQRALYGDAEDGEGEFEGDFGDE